MARPRGRSWQPGQSGNPKGRPPGIKEALPRGLMARIWLAAAEANEEQIRQIAVELLTNRRTALAAMELVARLGREIGPGVEGPVQPATIILSGALDPSRVRRKEYRQEERP